VACLAPTAAQPQECSPAGATRQATGPTRTRARRRPPGPAIAPPLPALRDRPSDTAAPAVAGPAARPVTITMLPTPTPPTPFRASVIPSRDRRRSPAATPEASQIAHGSDLTSQSNGISERPSCPSCPPICRPAHPTASTATRGGRNLHRPTPLSRRGHPVRRVRSTEPARPQGHANSDSFSAAPAPVEIVTI